MTTNTRRNIMMPDALWDAAVQASLGESVECGYRVTTSEWIRDAMLKKLGRDEVRKDGEK